MKREKVLGFILFLAFFVFLFLFFLLLGFKNIGSPDIVSSEREFVSLSPFCSGNPVEEKITNYLDLAEEKEGVREMVLGGVAELPLWNNGENYAPELFNQAIALGPNGGEIVIPPGRYKMNSRLVIDIPNVVIRAEELGSAIFEPEEGIPYDVIGISESGRNFSVVNLTFIGKAYDYCAIGIYGPNSSIIGNAMINMSCGITSGEKSNGSLIKGNYVFDAGYNPLILSGGARIDGGICDAYLNDVNIIDNYISGGYQGIVLNCGGGGNVSGNIVRNATISGIRSERSKNMLLENNFLFDNQQDGLILYSNSDNMTVDGNILIDNHRGDFGHWPDCWSAQPNITYDYVHNRPDGFYPHRLKENGNFIFLHLFCQTEGQQLELRYGIDNATIKNNIIGKYRDQDRLTYHDLQVSYFTLWYASKSEPVSSGSIFEGNVFLDYSENSVKDKGCDSTYGSNLAFNLSSCEMGEINLAPTYNVICEFQRPCTGSDTRCNVCNNNGICEYYRGEMTSNCLADCPRLSLGQNGTRQLYQQCVSGLDLTELLYPAMPGCFNYYDGNFTCTDCGNGTCDFGETYCSCPNDCDHCIDGIKTGDEVGVDCGGSCEAVCPEPPASPEQQGGGEGGGGGGGGGRQIVSECEDGIDNDFDGFIDYPEDGGCNSTSDDDELNVLLPVAPAQCEEDWDCTDWGDCSGGLMTRSCTDLNLCGTDYDQPMTKSSCGTDLGGTLENPIPYSRIFLSAVAAIFGAAGAYSAYLFFLFRRRD